MTLAVFCCRAGSWSALRSEGFCSGVAAVSDDPLGLEDVAWSWARAKPASTTKASATASIPITRFFDVIMMRSYSKSPIQDQYRYGPRRREKKRAGAPL